MFFKIGVLKNFAAVKRLRWSLFLIKLKKEEAPTLVFSYEHCEILRAAFIEQQLPVAAFTSLIK